MMYIPLIFLTPIAIYLILKEGVLWLARWITEREQADQKESQ